MLTSGVFAQQRAPVTVGYVAAFKGLDATLARADLSAYTHINLAFANPDANGAMVRGDALVCMADASGAMVSRTALGAAVAKAKAEGAKVLVSVAGGVIPSCSGDWTALLAPERRPAVVANLVALVEEMALDGLDIDIEGALLTEIDRAGNYTPFIAELSKALAARGKLLTCATASYEGGMIPRSSIPYFDLVNVMSYDAIGPSWGSAGAEHSNYATAERDLSLWLERGVARERLVLGVPFYGYGFGGQRPSWSYREIAAAHGDAATAGDLIGEACAGCGYITFNSPATIERKARLAGDRAGGVMVWELSQDTDDHVLTKAIAGGLMPRS